MILRFLALALLVVTPALAQKKSAKDASAAFRLNGIAPTSEAVPPPEATSTPESAAKPDDAAVAAAAADVPPPPPGKFTLDTPIAALIADPSAKAVLDRDLPGLSDDANLDKFKGMSLRQFQPATGGQLTDAMLAKVGTDLGDPDANKPTPAAAVASPKKHQDTGR